MDPRLEEREAAANEMIARLAAERAGDQSDGLEASQDVPVEPADDVTPRDGEDVVAQADGDEELVLGQDPPNPYAKDDVLQQPGSEDFEHKYRVLQGIYRKEVAEVAAQNRHMQALLAEKEARIQELSMRQPPQDAQQPVPAEDLTVDLKKFEEYDPEIQQLAKLNAALAAQNKSLQQQMADVLKAVDSTKQQVRQVSEGEFERSMDTMVPDWRKQDADPAFIEWLGGRSPLTGRPIQESLATAYEARDAARCAGIFNQYRSDLFLRMSRMQPPQQAAQPVRRVPTPAPPSRGGMQPSGSVQPTAKDLSRLTQEFAKLQGEGLKGLWEGRESEFRAKEAELHAQIVQASGA